MDDYFHLSTILMTSLGVILTEIDWLSVAVLLIGMGLLLVLSAFISASEVAYFGLSKTEINEIGSSGSKSGQLVAELIQEPKKLLTTILICNNTINIGLVILSTIFVQKIQVIGGPYYVYFISQVVLITAFILLFGEILPKIYATKKGRKTALFMAMPLKYLRMVFGVVSFILIQISSLFDKVFKEEKKSISVDELSKVHELVGEHSGNEQERKMLDGIVEFGNTEVKNVMVPRTDVVAIEADTDFDKVKRMILSAGFSRIPVYEKSFDKIRGILYVKDLLPHISSGKDFSWKTLTRQPFFVPENKKLDDLLTEFQEKKIHLAVAVDEYGGTSGVITMEDVIEEIVGDIRDEFDDDPLEYSKIGENVYSLDGKIQLKDLYKILEIDGENFENYKGDSDTVAGFLLELKGEFPFIGEKISFNQFGFTVEAMDKRRIKRVKLEINK